MTKPVLRVAALVAAAGLVAAAPAADGSSRLSLHRAKTEIRSVFQQELTYASGTSTSQHLGPCGRNSAKTVTCDTKATIDDPDNGTLLCTKFYRAHLSHGHVKVTESTNGGAFHRNARSHCVGSA